jgi:DNA-binding LytR/AlgR family response regulator
MLTSHKQRLESDEPRGIKLMDWLPYDLKGELISLIATDYYVGVTANAGNYMNLMRFTDSLGEIPEDTGLKVHRYHWAAHGKVENIVKEGGRIFLRAFAKQNIPVSKSYRKAVRVAGWLK